MMLRFSSVLALVALAAAPVDGSFVNPSSNKAVTGGASPTSLNQEALRPEFLESQVPLIDAVVDEWKKSDPAAERKNKRKIDLTLTRPTQAFLKLGIALTLGLVLTSPELGMPDRINSLDLSGFHLNNFQSEHLAQFFSSGSLQVQRLFQSGRDNTVQTAVVAREVILANYARLQTALADYAMKVAVPSVAIPMGKIEELQNACASGVADCETIVRSQISGLSDMANQVQLAWMAQIAVQKARLTEYQTSTDAFILSLPALLAGYQHTILAQFQAQQSEWTSTLVAWDAEWRGLFLAQAQAFSEMAVAQVAVASAKFAEVNAAATMKIEEMNVMASATIADMNTAASAKLADVNSIASAKLAEMNIHIPGIGATDADMTLPTTAAQAVADASPAIQAAHSVPLSDASPVQEAARVLIASARTVSPEYDELLKKLFSV